MENATVSSTITDFLSTTDIIVGTTYIVEAAVFIPLHILCSYLMYTDKKMKNPTYAFMVNLSIIDCIELSMLGIYSGIIILTKYENDTLGRIASFLCIGAWYANSVLFALIAFSRWIALTRPHMTKIVLRKSVMWSLQAGSWLVIGVFCFYACVLYPPGPFMAFAPSIYAWVYDSNSAIGRAFVNWGDISFDGICTIVEMSFNIYSLIWVHKTRKLVQSVDASKNKKREIKLLVQSFTLGCVFTAAYALFVIVYALQLDNLATCIGVQAVWTFNHCVNPLVYLSVNNKLRDRVLKSLTCGKLGLGTTKVNTVFLKSSVAPSAGIEQ